MANLKARTRIRAAFEVGPALASSWVLTGPDDATHGPMTKGHRPRLCSIPP